MNTLYSILSSLAALAFGYAFMSNLEYSFEFNYVVFMLLLVLLFFIFVIISALIAPKKIKTKSLFYNSYSDKRTKNDEFDKHYSFMNE